MTTRIRIELASPMGIALTLGVSSGVVLGIGAGLPGVVAGLGFGVLAGLVVGTGIKRDEGRRSARSRELDAIIGVSGGDLGAAPVYVPREDEAAEESWAAEWLTPPPPVVG